MLFCVGETLQCIRTDQDGSEGVTGVKASLCSALVRLPPSVP